ncbi:hypothetical protein B1218_32630 [Pseudomonas ogarae]|nr:hypothetical protein B1218_32630 [Pseudomonas ogarae]
MTHLAPALSTWADGDFSRDSHVGGRKGEGKEREEGRKGGGEEGGEGGGKRGGKGEEVGAGVKAGGKSGGEQVARGEVVVVLVIRRTAGCRSAWRSRSR